MTFAYLSMACMTMRSVPNTALLTLSESNENMLQIPEGVFIVEVHWCVLLAQTEVTNTPG